MSLEFVDFLVTDDAHPPAPLAGAVLKITSEDGSEVFGQVTTDGDGAASLLLSSGATYQARLFKFGVSFQRALLFEVEDGGPNDFSAVGSPYVYPSATDARLCTASGHFRTPTGGVAKHVDVHFIPKWSPILLEGSPIMNERVTIRTGADGYAEITLVRFGKYDATIEGMEDYQRTVVVPDAAAVNLGDLLFPVVSAVEIEEVGPYSVPAGDPLVLTPHVFSSDLNELGLTDDLVWTTSDPDNLTLEIGVDTFTLKGVNPGTYELRASRRDSSVVKIPDTSVVGLPISVVVT